MALFIFSTLKCSPHKLKKCFVLPVIIISFLFKSKNFIVSPIKYRQAPAQLEITIAYSLFNSTLLKSIAIAFGSIFPSESKYWALNGINSKKI